MNRITYTDKVTLNSQPDIADINKVVASDMNQIKSAVNGILDGDNGYIKFDDGTMITYQEETNTIPCNSSWGSLYYGVDNTTYSFPQEFISAPTVISSVKSTTSTGCIDTSYNAIEVTSTTVKNFSIVRPTSNNSVAIKISILAIGKWK